MKQVGTRLWRDIKNLWIAAAAVVIYVVLVNLVFHAFCPMVIVTGFPCPGCGMTRAVFYLLTGQIVKSIQMHPLGIWVVCLAVYFFWNRYILGKRAKGMKMLIGMTVIMLIVCYVWRMCLYFPDRVPYVYTKQNILARMIPFYEKILHELPIL